jgi:hypothetical protein
VKDNFGKKYILSGQKYTRADDEDMCDFSIGFYKTLYGLDVLKDDELFNEEFAGDTMIDNYKKDINNYHCLANFWILPMKVGRTCGKLNRSRMHMDTFLKRLNEDDVFSEYSDEYKYYFEKFTKETFVQKHYLFDSFIHYDWNDIVIINNVDDAKDLIHKRASVIASKRTNELYKYFKSLKICY